MDKVGCTCGHIDCRKLNLKGFIALEAKPPGFVANQEFGKQRTG
jgi:hypothetical protein